MWAVVEFLPEKLFELWGFPVTNTLLTTYLAMGVLIGVALLARVTLKTIPGHFQSVVELMSEGAGGFVRNTFGSMKSPKATPNSSPFCGRPIPTLT